MKVIFNVERPPDGVLERIVYRGYTIDIVYDHDPESPLEWDHLGIILSIDTRLNLGHDKIDRNEFNSMKKIIDYIIATYNPVGLYTFDIYDHSGVELRFGHSAYKDWDTRLGGFIFTTEERLQYMGVETRDPKEIQEYLMEELKEYNQYLAGEVYCYEVRDGEGNEIDFCCNYYDTDIAMLDAKIIINSEIEHRFKKHIQRLKKYIKKKVPLIYRKPFRMGY